jgi:hypothetical protein
MKLSIELVPSTCWGVSLKKKLKKSDWDKIRKQVYERDKMHCHICGTECESLDAHETWEFDENEHVQRLLDIIGVCKACHNSIHYGRAQKIGYEKEAKEQFIKVNNCSTKDLNEELARAKNDFIRRSKIEDWTSDFTFIEKQGYVVNKD